MVETDFLALIEQGAEHWNRWRAEHPKVQPDLSTAYLFGQSLTGFNFSGANLERACLIGANLRGANLNKTCLRAAYASNADLSEANLSGADLSRGNFGEADFSKANLSIIQASGTNFAQACFTGAYLANWKIDPATNLNDLRGSHVYLNSKKQQLPSNAYVKSKKQQPPAHVYLKAKKRQPKRGQFQPGELAALLEQLSNPEASAKAVAATYHRQSRAVLVGFGATAALALTGLTATFRSNSANLIFAEPPATRPMASVFSLPCKDIKTAVLPIHSAAHEYPDGARYYGGFENGEPTDGQGTMIYPDGNRYDGAYKDGARNGCGTFTFENGRRYVGEFKADQFNGQGTWVLETGERYIGGFENNQCSGKGTFIFFNGSSKSGIWEAGKLKDGDLSCDQGGLALPLAAD